MLLKDKKKQYLKFIFLGTLFLIGLFSAYTSQAQFITKWKTTIAEESITIPTSGGGYNYSVDWGDGSALSTGQSGDATHNYDTAGTYTVSITGVFPQIFFGFADNTLRAKIVEISQWGNNAWRSMRAAFQGCNNLDIIATDVPVLTGVTDMSQMFLGCSKLNPTGEAGIVLNTWNTSGVKNMAALFREADSFNRDISKWNTSAVTDMNSMFNGATSFNQDIGNWNTILVTNMSFMFSEASSFNQNIGIWRTDAVTTMFAMFQVATSFNQDIGSWDLRSVKNLSYMFNQANSFNQNIGSWHTEGVTAMTAMFPLATSFNQDISSWNTVSVKDMSKMFYQATSFNQNIGNWKTGAVTNMEGMFNGAFAFNQNLGNWNISAVTDMSRMLDYTALDIPNYDNTLIGWAAQAPENQVPLGALKLKFCKGDNARTSLISTYGWTITGDQLDCSTAPIELISFTVQKSGTHAVKVNWASGVESNVASMSVQHSNDANNWKSIYTCAPKGSNSNYETLDNNPVAGNNYYRLLTTDLDGSQQYSDVRSVNFSSSLLPNVYPNPTSGSLTIRNIKSGDVIVLTDLTGRQMLKKQATAETELLGIHSLSQGMYFISIMRDGKIVVNDKITKL